MYLQYPGVFIFNKGWHTLLRNWFFHLIEFDATIHAINTISNYLLVFSIGIFVFFFVRVFCIVSQTYVLISRFVEHDSRVPTRHTATRPSANVS